MKNKMIRNKVILEIIENYRTLWSLYHLSALAGWDLNTYMPRDGIEARAAALSSVSVLAQKIFLDKKFVCLIERAGREKNLNDCERGIVRVLVKSLDHYRKLPPRFIEEFEKVTSNAHSAWKEARERNRYHLFKPYLLKIVRLSREKAEYLGYSEHPYDALLGIFEEGLTTAQVQEYFNSIKNPVMELLKYIKSSRKYRGGNPLEKEKYDVEKMKDLNTRLLLVLHGSTGNLRLDVSPHPFSTSLGWGDTRITTRYEGKDFARAYSSTIHEFGHALYEIQSSRELSYTPVAGGSSLVIHESQSRFWENMIGKSPEFIKKIYPCIKKLGKYGKYSAGDICVYLNSVKPGLIRTEADEVTYHLHVLVRFEIEKGLLEGKISVNDLPEIWAAKYNEYLGVKPLTDTGGILQDIHWSQGSLGYFPTYSLGTALSVIWKNKIENDLGTLSVLLKGSAGIREIKDWLRQNIHRFGSVYVFNDLVINITGRGFDPGPFLNYLQEKYKKIYQ